MLRWQLVAFYAAVLALPAAAGPLATPRFATPVTVATATGVGSLTEQQVGDVNADGLADVVVTRIAYPLAYETFPIGIFLGDGRGGFRDGSSLFSGPIPRTQHGRQILIADFNGDRRNDIFVADHGYDASPFPGFQNTLVLSTADGKLVDASGNLPQAMDFSHSAATADVDRDGDLDIYVGNVFGGDRTPPSLLLNDGSGRFTRSTGLLPAEQTDIARNRYTRALFVDVNRDGAPDLVLGAENNTPRSAVLLNDGSGRFRAVPDALPAKEFGPTGITISLATLDANRDDKPDLLAGFQREDFTGRRIQVLIGNGDGTFRDETAARLPEQDDGILWPYAIRVADVNGDERDDFAVSNSLGLPIEQHALYLNDGTGAFRPSKLENAAGLLSLVDANGDGHPDLLTSAPGNTTGNPERHILNVQLVVPGAPLGLKAKRDRRGVLLTWRAVPGAESYQVWRGSPRRLLARPARSRLVDRKPPRVAVYWVRAVNDAGAGPFSAPARPKR